MKKRKYVRGSGERNRIARNNKLVDKIAAIRANNNIEWMSLLRLAINFAPPADKIKKRITKNDQRVINWMGHLKGKHR